MPLTAYFDNNVYDHIYKGQVPFQECQALSNALRKKDISLYFSLANIEEVIPILLTKPETGIQQIRFILDCAYSNGFVKPSGHLIEDELLYCCGLRESFTPFLEDSVVLSNIAKLRNPDEQCIEELKQVAVETRAQVRGFQCTMRIAQRKAQPLARRDRASFNVVWNSLAPAIVESIAESLGVTDVYQRQGIDTFLKARSLRLFVDVNVGLIYSQLREGRAPQIGDSRDIHHAVCSSVAEVFVTHDRELARIMKRSTLDSYQVTNLTGLLKRLETREGTHGPT